jgi:hypothetical protein
MKSRNSTVMSDRKVVMTIRNASDGSLLVESAMHFGETDELAIRRLCSKVKCKFVCASDWIDDPRRHTDDEGRTYKSRYCIASMSPDGDKLPHIPITIGISASCLGE